MWRMRDLLVEAMDVSGSTPVAERAARLGELLDALGLEAALLDRRVHELSGGQKQRFALARALATGAGLLVLDEPLTALDPPAQRAATTLFHALKRERGVTTLLVSHDLDLVRGLADDVVVLYRGRVVESGPTAAVLGTPRHPYTRLLLASVMPPNPAEARRRLAALPPDDAVAEPAATGCAFAPRCSLAVDACRATVPTSTPVDGSADHAAACPLAVWSTRNSAARARPPAVESRQVRVDASETIEFACGVRVPPREHENFDECLARFEIAGRFVRGDRKPFDGDVEPERPRI
jgi:oligopeptide/dipeptide ABC transporter ATP-binding protein